MKINNANHSFIKIDSHCLCEQTKLQRENFQVLFLQCWKSFSEYIYSCFQIELFILFEA